MFSVENNNNSYRVNFVHTTTFATRHHPARRMTVCEVFVNDPEVPKFIGTAVCHDGDNYVRSTGRKLSLTDAIKDFDRELRTEFWNKYFELSKP